MILTILHIFVITYFYLTILLTAKNTHMMETVNNASEIMWKQPKLQHLHGGTMQNHQNSQTRQEVFWPRSVPRILQIQKNATITFSNHLFYSHKMYHQSQPPKALQKYGA